MTEDEKKICTNLFTCRFLPGSWDKRFCKSLSFKARETPDKELTEKERYWMYRLLHKYRKQLPLTYAKYQHLIPND